MKNLLRWLSRSRYPYEPLITVEISRSAILANLESYRKLAPGGAIAPVLKSNAYGHGLLEVARILEGQPNLPFFVVDSYFEAVALRSHGVSAPLLVIGYTRPETMIGSNLRKAAFTITTLDTLKDLAGATDQVRIHLKVDSGMRRQGILPAEIEAAGDIIKANPAIVLEGICTHLGDADNPDETFTREQIRVWNECADAIVRRFPEVRHIHATATEGSRFAADARANVNRIGIGMYRNALEMKTIITGVKRLKAGETVGYGNTFEAPFDMRIATVPVGYFEGIDRRLSNCGTILVGNDRVPCPIVGRVSMNITTVNVTHAPAAAVGSPAIVISKEPYAANSVAAIAKLCGTIDYEVLVRIPAHLKRVVVD